MTDIFISYAREDRARAARLANALEASGWSVWWDRKIIAGQSFDEAIERELEAAKRILVLWSKDSINSEWVRNEAAVAAERGVLVPALIDPVKLPLEFRRKQTLDLVDWDGDPAHEGFRALCDAMEVGSPLVRDEAAVPGPSPARSGSRSPWRRPWALMHPCGAHHRFGPWRVLGLDGDESTSDCNGRTSAARAGRSGCRRLPWRRHRRRRRQLDIRCDGNHYQTDQQESPDHVGLRPVRHCRSRS